jgi:hypothetical protein
MLLLFHRKLDTGRPATHGTKLDPNRNRERIGEAATTNCHFGWARHANARTHMDLITVARVMRRLEAVGGPSRTSTPLIITFEINYLAWRFGEPSRNGIPPP